MRHLFIVPAVAVIALMSAESQELLLQSASGVAGDHCFAYSDHDGECDGDGDEAAFHRYATIYFGLEGSGEDDDDGTSLDRSASTYPGLEGEGEGDDDGDESPIDRYATVSLGLEGDGEGDDDGDRNCLARSELVVACRVSRRRLSRAISQRTGRSVRPQRAHAAHVVRYTSLCEVLPILSALSIASAPDNQTAQAPTQADNQRRWLGNCSPQRGNSVDLACLLLPH